MNVEVVFVRERLSRSVQLTLEEGLTVADAVERSGLLPLARQQSAKPPKLGVFGKLVTPKTALENGDRVEIYAALECIMDDDDDEDEDDE